MEMEENIDKGNIKRLISILTDSFSFESAAFFVQKYENHDGRIIINGYIDKEILFHVGVEFIEKEFNRLCIGFTVFGYCDNVYRLKKSDEMDEDDKHIVELCKSFLENDFSIRTEPINGILLGTKKYQSELISNSLSKIEEKIRNAKG